MKNPSLISYVHIFREMDMHVDVMHNWYLDMVAGAMDIHEENDGSSMPTSIRDIYV